MTQTSGVNDGDKRTEQDLRTEVAYLLWCMNEGYYTPKDRAIGGGNWMYRPVGQLHPDDIRHRREMLAVAEAVLNALSDAGWLPPNAKPEGAGT